MRELWLKLSRELTDNEKKKLIENMASQVSAIVVESEDISLAKDSGAKTIVSLSANGNIVLAKTLKEVYEAKKKGKKACIVVTVKSKRDEGRIIAAAEASSDYVIAKCPDWKVIPLENLIAAIHGKTKLLAAVSDLQEAKTALAALEIGVDGVVVENSDIKEVEKIHAAITKVKTRKVELESAEKLELLPARVTEVKPLSSGARVCIDTCDLMKEGEGLLVGCQSAGLFLVEAEIRETPFVASRPFRVNAGSISMYVLAPSGKTRYLSELKAGDEVLIVDRNGRSRTTNVGRVKIEWRPLLMVEAEQKGTTIKTILQDAETIRVVTDGGSKSVKDLSVGDIVLVRIEEGGRHFGTLVKEEKVIER
jgi:3-dehydroquinate synthase II